MPFIDGPDAASAAAGPDPGADPGPARRRRWPAWVALLVAVLLVRLLVAHPQRVGGDSMTPTLRSGDVVLSVRPGLLGRVDPLCRGDLVSFADPTDGDPVLKRVVGLPGDTVTIEDAVTAVNGRVLAEPYVDPGSIDGLYYGPVQVPAGQVLVMGDDRALSVDSRAFGPVPLDALTGRVVLRLWPWWR